jgi:hypothetical protein
MTYPRSRRAPSPYAVAVLRALLRKPMKVPQLAAATTLAERTVRAQITALRAADVVMKIANESAGRSGPWAIYGILIDVLI